jgi:hypothetical protein
MTPSRYIRSRVFLTLPNIICSEGEAARVWGRRWSPHKSFSKRFTLAALVNPDAFSRTMSFATPTIGCFKSCPSVSANSFGAKNGVGQGDRGINGGTRLRGVPFMPRKPLDPLRDGMATSMDDLFNFFSRSLKLTIRSRILYTDSGKYS